MSTKCYRITKKLPFSKKQNLKNDRISDEGEILLRNVILNIEKNIMRKSGLIDKHRKDVH